MGLTPGRQSPLSEAPHRYQSSFAKMQILIDFPAEQKLSIIFSYLLAYEGQLVDKILKQQSGLTLVLGVIMSCACPSVVAWSPPRRHQTSRLVVEMKCWRLIRASQFV